MELSGPRHVWAPERYVAWMNGNLGFNPRSGRQSVALSEYMLDDLIYVSQALRDRVQQGGLEVKFDPEISTRFMVKRIDLALLDPHVPAPSDVADLAPHATSHRGQLLAEHKAIMTAHGKQRKNRISDIGGYVSHIHNHSAEAVAGFTVVINVSPLYRNPDSWASEIARKYTNMAHIVGSTVQLFTSLPLRNSPSDSYELPEGIAVMLVDYDGEHSAKLVTSPPAPQPGEPTHWTDFIERMAEIWEARFP